MPERKFGIDLRSYDDIFKTEEEREEDRLSKIRDIPISEIDDFPDHPFMVRDDVLTYVLKNYRGFKSDVLMQGAKK